jgi:hypothetical protein
MQPAVAEFISGLPESVELTWPIELEVEPMASTRVADVALLLGLIALFWALGKLLASSGMKGLRPFVFASGLTGILLLFFTNSAFWMVKGLKVDESGVTLTQHLGEDPKLAWGEITALRFEGGRLFPAFTDDASLVLVANDRELAIPRFIPGSGEAARRIEAYLRDKSQPPAGSPAP